MLGLVDSFSDKWLAFVQEQTVPHHWLTCFSIPMKMSFWINSLRKAKESLPLHQELGKSLEFLGKSWAKVGNFSQEFAGIPRISCK